MQPTTDLIFEKTVRNGNSIHRLQTKTNHKFSKVLPKPRSNLECIYLICILLRLNPVEQFLQCVCVCWSLLRSPNIVKPSIGGIVCPPG